MIPSAKKAIDILEKIGQWCGPQYVAYWVLPNSVLTLSGARAFCDGVFWSDDNDQLDVWKKEINQSLDCMRKIISVKSFEVEVKTVRDNEKFASFEIILDEGLRNVLQGTILLDSNPADFEIRGITMQDIMEKLIINLRTNRQLDKYSKEDLNHIAFGILVGYPDEAILGTVSDWGDNDSFREPLADADIIGSDFYICPQPIYSYPRHLVNDPVILAHQKQWSTILKDFYSSEFHSTLQANSDFMDKMKELKNLH